MNNELIKKAYKDFNGVWPYGDGDSMIISGKLNSTWGEGQYAQTDAESQKHFEHFHGHHLWKWVGTKADFDAHGESLKEGPTETDFVLGSNIWEVDKYKVQVKFVDRDGKWTPEVGQECEILCDYSLCGNFPIALKEGDKVVIQDIVDLGFGGVALVSDKGIKGTGTIIFSQLRPLKTEDEKQADEMFDIVKDATDTYHACELLVKNGYKKCAG